MRYVYVKFNNAVRELKRVSELTGPLPEGGPDAYVAHLLHVAKGSDVLLLSVHFIPSSDEHFTHDRVTAYSYYWYSRVLERFGRAGRSPIGTLFRRTTVSIRLFMKIYRFRPERVVCWSASFPLWATFLAARLRSAKFVYCRHTRLGGESEPWFRRLTDSIDKIIMRHASAVIVHGPYLSRQMQEIRVPESRVIEFTWSFRDFGKVPNSVALVNGNGLFHESKIILFIGRLEASKGVFDLIEACADLLRTDSEVKLIFAGDGNARGELRRAIDRQDIETSVELKGMVSHDALPSLISQARLIATPTRSSFPEGRCMAAMEGLVMGKPVVAPEFGPFPYLVVNECNGLLFQPDSVQDLRAKLTKAIYDEKLYAKMKTGAECSGKKLRQATLNFGGALRDAFGGIDLTDKDT